MIKEEKTRLFYAAVGKNIYTYRKIRNYSLQILAEKIGVTKKTIQRYENGEIKIDMGRLSDIAEALNVDVSQLLDGAKSFLGIEEATTVKVPIVGQVSCGNGSLAYEDIEGYEAVPKEWVSGGSYFFLRAKGDSMIGARIHDGDLLLIRQQSTVENGEIAAVLIDNDEAVLKRVYKKSGVVILQPENPQYSPIVCKPGDKNIRIIGKLKKTIINM